jgi:restriction endonuclease S subunit
MVRLGEVVEVLDNQRKPITKSDRKTGQYPYYGATGIVDYVGDFIFNERLVLVGEDGAKWNTGDNTAFIAEGKYWVNNHAHVLRPLTDKIIDTYLVETLNYMDLTPFVTGVTVPKLNQENLKSIQIPLPPLEVQQEIVAKIEKFQAIINGAKQVVENYQPQIDINPEWEMVELGEVCESITTGTTPDTKRPDYYKGNNFFVKTSEIVNKPITATSTFISDLAIHDYRLKIYDPDTVLIAMYGQGKTRGQVGILKINASITQNAAALSVDKNRLNPLFLFYCLLSNYENLRNHGIDGHISHLNLRYVSEFKVPLPPLSEQAEIVARIEKEQALVNANRELMAIFEEKIKAEIAKVWGSD